ncbi:UNVERIFIED_CONTAM: hypothetical protein FKN15_055800 [Acipenser sinensis]
MRRTAGCWLLLSGLLALCGARGALSSLADQVIWAVNCGGEAHTDTHGIHYKKDPLEGKLGKASDYGMRLPILRSSPEDQILYQTERYNEDSFSYEVPIREEGDYVLVLKFAEVYFAQSQQKKVQSELARIKEQYLTHHTVQMLPGVPSDGQYWVSCVSVSGTAMGASDYGMRLPILRSSPEDQILYQTERYNEDSFSYEVPIREEGDYVLVLKFAEVYFAQSQQKVFDVKLNSHFVVKDLDIFDKVGHSTAHDEIVPFSIVKGKLSVNGEVSTFNGKLTVEFVKGYYDNPKVCGLYVMKGTLEDVPKLQPHPGLEKKEEEEEEEEEEEGGEGKKTPASKHRVQSGPRTPNPYAADNSSLMFPILVSFGVFIPTLFCLCRL